MIRLVRAAAPDDLSMIRQWVGSRFFGM